MPPTFKVYMISSRLQCGRYDGTRLGGTGIENRLRTMFSWSVVCRIVWLSLAVMRTRRNLRMASLLKTICCSSSAWKFIIKTNRVIYKSGRKDKWCRGWSCLWVSFDISYIVITIWYIRESVLFWAAANSLTSTFFTFPFFLGWKTSMSSLILSPMGYTALLRLYSMEMGSLDDWDINSCSFSACVIGSRAPGIFCQSVIAVIINFRFVALATLTILVLTPPGRCLERILSHTWACTS